MKMCISCENKFSNLDWQCPSCGFAPEQLLNFPAFSPHLSRNETGFKQDDFSKLAEVEEKNFWFEARNQLIIWALKQYFPLATNFLEIGCGTGFVLSGIQKAAPKLKLNGSEISAVGLEFAKQRINNASLFQMDARQIPFVEEFDVIGAFDVLEHIQEDQQVLAQLHQAVQPNGGIILTVPQHQFLWSQQDEYAHHVRRYNALDLKKKVIGAGFEIIKITSFVSLLLPFMLISRFLKRKKVENYDSLSELKLSTSLNLIFEKILCFERYMICLGLNIPVGGSLLLIAKKVTKRSSLYPAG